MSKDETIDLGKEKMSLYEFARWAGLFEAVELIANKCSERGIDFDSVEGLKFIKPLDIQDYVNSRTDSMVVTIQRSRTFERDNAFTQIQRIKQNIFDFSSGKSSDIGLPV